MYLNFLRSERKSISTQKIKGLFFYGRAYFGLDSNLSEANNFVNINGFENLKDYDVSDYHSLVVTTLKNQSLVWSIGNVANINFEDQCVDDTEKLNEQEFLETVKKEFQISYKPQLIKDLFQHKITKVSCGFSHCFAVSDSGLLFAWGLNFCGELGLGKELKYQTSPKQLVNLSFIVADVCASKNFTMIISDSGLLYSCGSNTSEQLGIDTLDCSVYTPTLVEFFTNIPIKSISCGEKYAVAITKHKNMLYSWGYGSNYQLGHGEPKNEKVPKLINYFQKHLIKINSVTCASHHTVAVTWDGLCYVWGSGLNGELGLGNKTIAKYPTLHTNFTELSVKMVSVHSNCSFFVTDTGDVYVSGSGLATSFMKSSCNIPQKLNLDTNYALSLKSGGSYCIMYSDYGEMSRNQSIGKILSHEKLYSQKLSFFCEHVMTPLNEISCISAFDSLKSIHHFHYKHILKPMLNKIDILLLQKTDISQIWIDAFDDKEIIKIYMNYVSNFLESWNMLLDCINFDQVISDVVQVVMSDSEFSTANFKNQGVDELYAILSTPLNYFSNIIIHFNSLLNQTNLESSEYSSILNLLKLFNDVNSALTNIQNNNKYYLQMIDFVNKFPSCADVLLNHGNYILSSRFSMTQEYKFDHTLHIFSDMIIILLGFDIKHKLLFDEFFFCECTPPISNRFMIFTKSYSYTIYMEDAEHKNSVIAALETSLNKWISTSTENKNMYLSTVMSVVSKNIEIINSMISNSFYKSKYKIHSKLDLFSKFNTNEINQFVSNIKKVRDEFVFFEEKSVRNDACKERDMFVIFLSQEVSNEKFNNYLATRTKKSLLNNNLFGTVLKKSDSVNQPDTNYKIAMYLNGNITLETAKKIFYEKLKKSFWSRLIYLQPLNEYCVKLCNFENLVLSEDCPINSLAVIKFISSLSFVNPHFELKLNEQRHFYLSNKISVKINRINEDLNFSFNEDLMVYYQLTCVFTNPKILSKLNSNEIVDFRKKLFSLRNQLFFDEKSFQSSNQYIHYVNENILGEPVASSIPSVIEVFVTCPSINSVEYCVSISPYDTVKSLYANIFAVISLNDKKSKSNNKLTKFMKKMTGDYDSESSSENSSHEKKHSYHYMEQSEHQNLKQKSIIKQLKSPIFSSFIKKKHNKDSILSDLNNRAEQDFALSKMNSQELYERNESNNALNAGDELEVINRREGEKIKFLTKEEKRLKKLVKRNLREQEKVIKNQLKRLKKEDHKHRKDVVTKQKTLYNGARMDDFMIKIAGCDDYILSYNLKLINYEYIVSSIEKEDKIELKFVQKNSLELKNNFLAQEKFDTVHMENILSQTPLINRKLSVINTNSYGDIKVDISLDNDTSEMYYDILSKETDFNNLYLNSLDNVNHKIHRPYWTLKNQTCCYSFKLINFNNLPDCPSAKYLYVSASIHYANLNSISKTTSSFLEYSSKPIFDEVLTFNINLCDIPRESKLVLILFARTEDSRASKTLDSDISVAWISKTIFNYNGYINNDVCSLRMWTGKARLLYFVSQNYLTSESNNLPIVNLELGMILFSELLNKKKDYLSIFTESPKKKSSNLYKVPSDEDIQTLDEISKDNYFETLSNEQIMFIWNYRNWCRNNNPTILVNFLLNMNWKNRKLTHQVHNMISEWPLISATKALKLLSYKCSDTVSRKYGISCLSKLGNRELQKIMMQLVQALIYEPYHLSDLAFFLIERSFWSPNLLGNLFFWFSKYQETIPYFTERYSLIIEAYVRSCGLRLRKSIICQLNILDCIHVIAVKIRDSKSKLTRKTEKLKRVLFSINWPTFRYPFDMRYKCNGFFIEECKVFGSKNFPILLTLKTTENISRKLQIIYKIGDDLRQDFLVLQTIKLIDKLWKNEDLDMKLTSYRCLYRAPNCGIIEVVRDSQTTSNINIELGGLRAVYKDSTLLKWLKRHNTTESELNKAIENFTYSCAGYSVITFILGLADRHNDNIMLTKNGHLFHIDFSRFFGNYRKIFGKYVDKADFVLLNQYYEVMKDRFDLYIDLCCKAFNIIRHNPSLLVSLFFLMVGSGIPDLESSSEVLFIKDKLQPNMTDEEATIFFKKKINDAMNNSTIKLNHAFHVVYHGIKN